MVVVSPTRVIAACSALGAFSIAIVIGLAVDNPADVVLTRALTAMLVCWLVGAAVGAVMAMTADEALADYAQANPVPTTPEDLKPRRQEVAAESASQNNPQSGG